MCVQTKTVVFEDGRVVYQLVINLVFKLEDDMSSDTGDVEFNQSQTIKLEDKFIVQEFNLDYTDKRYLN